MFLFRILPAILLLVALFATDVTRTGKFVSCFLRPKSFALDASCSLQCKLILVLANNSFVITAKHLLGHKQINFRHVLDDLDDLVVLFGQTS